MNYQPGKVNAGLSIVSVIVPRLFVFAVICCCLFVVVFFFQSTSGLNAVFFVVVFQSDDWSKC